MPETRVKDPVLIMSETERKPARVQMRGPHDSYSTSLLTPSAAKSATRDQGVDPMSTIYLDSSTEVDLASTRVTLGSQTEGAAYATAPTTRSGPNSLYLTDDLTAQDGMPSGTPCASSTRKKEETMDLSVQATHGSDDGTDEAEPKEGEAAVISPEQLRFTAAISKAMSKELGFARRAGSGPNQTQRVSWFQGWVYRWLDPRHAEIPETNSDQGLG